MPEVRGYLKTILFRAPLLANADEGTTALGQGFIDDLQGLVAQRESHDYGREPVYGRQPLGLIW